MLDLTRMGEFRAYIQNQIEEMQTILASMDAMGIHAPAKRGRPKATQTAQISTQPTINHKSGWTTARKAAQSRRAKLMWAKRRKGTKAMGAAA